MASHWKALVVEKRSRQQLAIPKDWVLKELPPKDVIDVTQFPEASGLLSTKEIDITTTRVDVLLEKLASGYWSSVDVTTAFSKRAIIAHQLTNCLTEIFIDRALARAAELDEHLKKTGTTVGPLHGLPISLKDQIDIKGLESTMGYVSWIGRYAERNAVLVDILLSLGAVLYVKTNIPQTLMWPETFNHVFGRTSNPHNRSLTSGGSSGGEGALVALKGSPLGVGSDVGGSVRIPAGLCGLYGLRPSYGRVPYAGCVNSLEGQDSIPSVLGPLSGSLDGVKSFMRGVVSRQPWLKDPLVVRKPWNESEYDLAEHGFGKALCFAILWDDGFVLPHPPITRGLRMVKNALEATGHKVIDWKPLKHDELCKTGWRIWNAGASEDYKLVTAPTGEPIISTMIPEADEMEFRPTFQPPSGGVSAYELWQAQKKKRDLRQEYLAHWEATNQATGTGRPVDAIIAPVAPFAAPPHGQYKAANYTIVWNVLDYTALTIPVSRVDPALDVKLPAHEFRSDADRENYEFYDDPATFRNAPISVQLVGHTLEEEAVIAMAEIVAEALKVPSTVL